MVMAYWARVKQSGMGCRASRRAAGTYDPAYRGLRQLAVQRRIRVATWSWKDGCARLSSLADVEAYVSVGVPVIASIRVQRGRARRRAVSEDRRTSARRPRVHGRRRRHRQRSVRRTRLHRRVYQRAQFERVWQDGSTARSTHRPARDHQIAALRNHGNNGVSPLSPSVRRCSSRSPDRRAPHPIRAPTRYSIARSPSRARRTTRRTSPSSSRCGRSERTLARRAVEAPCARRSRRHRREAAGV